MHERGAIEKENWRLNVIISYTHVHNTSADNWRKMQALKGHDGAAEGRNVF